MAPMPGTQVANGAHPYRLAQLITLRSFTPARLECWRPYSHVVLGHRLSRSAACLPSPPAGRPRRWQLAAGSEDFSSGGELYQQGQAPVQPSGLWPAVLQVIRWVVAISPACKGPPLSVGPTPNKQLTSASTPYSSAVAGTCPATSLGSPPTWQTLPASRGSCTARAWAAPHGGRGWCCSWWLPLWAWSLASTPPSPA